MPTLFLHIGHDKTGSSFLQSAFANSGEVFSDANVVYPLTENMKLARSGKISEGNGGLLFDILAEKQIEKSHFFSSEMIFQFMAEQLNGKKTENNYLQKLKTLIEGPLFEQTKVLLYIRNPIAHTISHYQQMVKRGGLIRDVNTYFNFIVTEGNTLPKRTRMVLEFLQSLSKCEVTVLNYSKGGNLLEEVRQWLGISEPFIPPVNMQVNRSLSEAELRLQIALNKKIGIINPPLSDYFVNRFPALNVRKVTPDLEIQQGLIQQCLPDLEWINQFVEPGHAYELDYLEPQRFDYPDFLKNKHYEIIGEWVKATLENELLKERDYWEAKRRAEAAELQQAAKKIY